MDLIGIHISDCGDLPVFLFENHGEAAPEIPFISIRISEDVPAVDDSNFIVEVFDLFHMEFADPGIGCGAPEHTVDGFTDAISPFPVGDQLIHVFGQDFFEQDRIAGFPSLGVLLDQGVDFDCLFFFSGFDLGESKGGNQEQKKGKEFHFSSVVLKVRY
jgi:hypothetical protein